MAESLHPKLQGARGAPGKQRVFEQYGKKTVITKYPDMTGVVPAEPRKKTKAGFRKLLHTLLPSEETR